MERVRIRVEYHQRQPAAGNGQTKCPCVLFCSRALCTRTAKTDINIMQRKTESIYNVIVAAFSATYFNILILGVHSWRACRTHTINKMPPYPYIHAAAAHESDPSDRSGRRYTLDMRPCHVHRLRMRQIFRSNMLELRIASIAIDSQAIH